MVASENLISLTDEHFSLKRFAGAERERVSDQRKSIRQEFNEAESDWRRNRVALGLLITYYHRSDSGIRSSRRNVEQAATASSTCVVLAMNRPRRARPEMATHCRQRTVRNGANG